MDGMSGSTWQKAIVSGFTVVFMIAGLIVSGFFLMTFGVILIGFLSGVATSLSLESNFTEAINNVTKAYFAILGDLIGGLDLAGSLILLAIVLIVLGGIAFGGYQGYKKLRGNSGGNAY